MFNNFYKYQVERCPFVCLFFCLYKDLENRWTDWTLFFRGNSYRSYDGFQLFSWELRHLIPSKKKNTPHKNSFCKQKHFILGNPQRNISRWVIFKKLLSSVCFCAKKISLTAVLIRLFFTMKLLMGIKMFLSLISKLKTKRWTR